MTKTLEIIYMSILFIFSLLFIAYYVRELFLKMTKRNIAPERVPEKPSEPTIDVVGKSTTTFLAPLMPETIEPIMSEKLEVEMKSEAETEPDINSEDVEANLYTPFVPDDDELYQYPNDNMDLTGGLSQGLTYQQISHVIDVVQGKKSDESDELIAGETLSIMPSDFLNMICTQVDNESIVKRLISNYVDSVDKIKPQPADITDFDIHKYV